MRQTLTLLSRLIPQEPAEAMSDASTHRASSERLTSFALVSMSMRLAVSTALVATAMSSQAAQTTPDVGGQQVVLQWPTGTPAVGRILATSSSEVERFVEMQLQGQGPAAANAHRLIVELAAIKSIVADLRRMQPAQRMPSQQESEQEELLASYFQQTWVMAMDAWQNLPSNQALVAKRMSVALDELARESTQEMITYTERDITDAALRIRKSMGLLNEPSQRDGPAKLSGVYPRSRP